MADFEALSPDAKHQSTAWLDIYPSLSRVYWAKEQFRKIYESERRVQAEILFENGVIPLVRVYRSSAT